ncbi:hypothetical protein ACXR2W_06705 [Leucobacter sp. HY1908]
MTSGLVDKIVGLGDKNVLRVVDFLLAADFDPHSYMGTAQPVSDLAWHLVQTGSSVEVVERDDRFRLSRRLPEGVEEAAQLSADMASESAGSHLGKAWAALNLLEPDTSKAINEAMKAAELAAGAVATPKDMRLRMSKIVQRLKSKDDWSLMLARRDDGVPDHRAMVIGMLETLSFAQSDRHGGTPQSAEEAQAYVLLASLVVGWFSTGAVAFNTER